MCLVFVAGRQEAVRCWRLGGSLTVQLFLLVTVRCCAENSKSYIQGNWKVLCFAREEASWALNWAGCWYYVLRKCSDGGERGTVKNTSDVKNGRNTQWNGRCKYQHRIWCGEENHGKVWSKWLKYETYRNSISKCIPYLKENTFNVHYELQKNFKDLIAVCVGRLKESDIRYIDIAWQTAEPTEGHACRTLWFRG